MEELKKKIEAAAQEHTIRTFPRNCSENSFLAGANFVLSRQSDLLEAIKKLSDSIDSRLEDSIGDTTAETGIFLLFKDKLNNIINKAEQ